MPKYKRVISGIEEKVIALYGRGMTTRDIHEQIKDLYGVEISAEMVSKITDKTLPNIKDWQSAPLDDVYPFVFMDAILSKACDNIAYSKFNFIENKPSSHCSYMCSRGFCFR